MTNETISALDLFRLRNSHGTYQFCFFSGKWERRWPLGALQAMLSESPEYRGYLNGLAKPSATMAVSK